MQKFFHAALEIIYWIGLFASPLLGSSVIAAIIYFSNTNLLWLAIVVLSIGAIFWILFTERVRKKYGCSNYMSRILSSSWRKVTAVAPTGITNEEERIGLNTENFSVHYRSSLLWP